MREVAPYSTHAAESTWCPGGFALLRMRGRAKRESSHRVRATKRGEPHTSRQPPAASRTADYRPVRSIRRHHRITWRE